LETEKDLDWSEKKDKVRLTTILPKINLVDRTFLSSAFASSGNGMIKDPGSEINQKCGKWKEDSKRVTDNLTFKINKLEIILFWSQIVFPSYKRH